MNVSDQALLDSWVKERDEAAFETLAARYAALIHAACQRSQGSGVDAEDVAQECFLALMTCGSGPGPYLGAWLYRVARNRAAKRARSERCRRDRERRYAMDHDIECAQTPHDDRYDHVNEVVATLPTKFRLPLIAHFLDGQTHQALARVMGISRQTVTYRIDRGIKDTRKALTRRGVAGAACIS